MAWYGGWAGPGPSYFRVVVDMRTVSQDDGGATIQVRRYVEVSGGSAFGGTILSTNWAGNTTLYGAGTYADSGWVNVGRFGYGSSTTQSAEAHYTGYSSGYHSSSASGTYSPSVPTYTPYAPYNGGSARSGDYGAYIAWTNNPTTTRPYTGIVLQCSVNGGAYQTIANLGATATSFTYGALSIGSSYTFRVAAKNGAGTSSYASCGTVTLSPYAPNAPTGVTATRENDNKVTVTWVNQSTATQPWAGVTVYRSANGGAWSAIANLGNVNAYADTSTSANNSYAYSVASVNSSGTSVSAASGTVYMTPAAPGSIAVARSGNTDVAISLSNTARTATALELQRSTNLTNWVAVKTVTGLVTSVLDSPGGGTFYYRARNTRGSLASAWVTSAAVVTICPPGAPTLVSPNSSSIVDIASGEVALRWNHNTIDGSAQSSAEVQLSTDNGATWKTVSVTTQSLVIDLTEYDVNTVLTWRVRTKGTHPDFGAWSATRTFRICQQPTASVLSPIGELHIVPLDLQVEYSDPSGTLLSTRVEITSESGEVVYADTFKSTEKFVSIQDFLPTEGVNYTVTFTVTSDTGLSAVVSSEFYAVYDKPYPASVACSINKETSFVSIEAMAPEQDVDYIEGDTISITGLASIVDVDTLVLDNMEFDNNVANINVNGPVEAASIEIFRVVNGESVLLVSADGGYTAALDKYAPLNTPIVYRSVTHSHIGAINTDEREIVVDSDSIFIVNEDTVFPVKLNPQYQIELELPNKEREHAWGRKYPVTFSDDALTDKRSIGGTVYGTEKVRSLYRFIEDGGVGVLKDYFGSVTHADFDGFSAAFEVAAGERWNVSMTAHRIDGGVL